MKASTKWLLTRETDTDRSRHLLCAEKTDLGRRRIIKEGRMLMCRPHLHLFNIARALEWLTGQSMQWISTVCSARALWDVTGGGGVKKNKKLTGEDLEMDKRVGGRDLFFIRPICYSHSVHCLYCEKNRQKPRFSVSSPLEWINNQFKV